MTRDEIQAIRERCYSVNGPWRTLVEGGWDNGLDCLAPRVVDSIGQFVCKTAWTKDWPKAKETNEFIAQAPATIYNLLAYIEQLQKEVDGFKNVVKDGYAHTAVVGDVLYVSRGKCDCNWMCIKCTDKDNKIEQLERQVKILRKENCEP